MSGWPGVAALGAVAVVAAIVVWSGAVDQVSVVAGGLVRMVAVIAGAGVVIGVAGRSRRWWATWGVGIAVADTVVIATAHWWILNSGLVNEHYPPTILLWVWFGLWASGVALTGWWSGGPAVRVARALAAPVALIAAFLLINAHYGYWPTTGVLLGRPVTGQVSAAKVYQEIRFRPTADGFLYRGADESLPRNGLYGPIPVPATPVYFDATKAWVWLPPAYFRGPSLQFPVLLMLTGIPGDVQDWVKAGQVIPLADAWARAHGGVAPVMIFVDENGRGDRDTECVNGPQGAAASYLTRDVPDWVNDHLGIRPNWRSWGVVGFSEGGTCAVGLAIEHPELFGTFVDVAGDAAPNYGGPAETLRYLYDGDQLAARSFEPEVILATHRYRHLQGWFAAGRGDRHGMNVARELAASAGRAGVEVHTYEATGGHTWTFARLSFAKIYPRLVTAVSNLPGGGRPSA
jgi:enterochelin esterase-like enzyme